MKEVAVKKWIRGLAIVQMLLSISFVALLLWAVSADPTGEFARGFVAGASEAVGSDGPLTYEDVGYVSFGPILYFLLSLIALIALKKGTTGWMKAGFYLSLFGSILGVASLSFPALEIAITALFFSIVRPLLTQKDGKKTTD